MKCEIVEEEKKVFRPIKLEITIESEEELCSLWHRFNIGKNVFEQKPYKCLDDLPHGIGYDVEVYLALNSLCDKYGLFTG